MDNEQTPVEEVTSVAPTEEVAPVEAPVEPELTAETPAEDVPVVEAEIAVEAGLDRSVYNCPDCSGEGLKDEHNVCRKCGGTGKIA